MQTFIEETFVSKVPQIGDYKLSNIVLTVNTGTKLDVTENKVSVGDLDIEVIVSSPKNYVDLVTKDFARTYLDSMKIFQNDMGYYDKFLKILKSNGDQRVHIFYNKIDQSEGKVTLERKIKPLPVKFSTTGNAKIALQKTFNILKHISLLRIYSNNYLRHCVHKPLEEEGSSDKETFVDLCVIFLETNKNRVK